MSEGKTTLLIVEDDLDIADMLNAYFRVQGYEVVTAHWGEDGVRAAQEHNPDLVVLDIRLPDIDGFQVAQELQKNRKTRDIPIIFLTERRGREDRLRGLELRAEDYITKPFDIQELRLRVRNTLQRSRQGTLTNPVTGFPEGDLVQEHLQAWLDDSTAGLYVVSLHNMDRFREVYGFVASDDLLRAVGLMLHDMLMDMASPDAFLGHLGPVDFVVVARFENRSQFIERAEKRLAQSFNYFYRDQDRSKGIFRENGLAVVVKEFVPHSGAAPKTVEQLRAALQTLYQ